MEDRFEFRYILRMMKFRTLSVWSVQMEGLSSVRYRIHYHRSIHDFGQELVSPLTLLNDIRRSAESSPGMNNEMMEVTPKVVRLKAWRLTHCCPRDIELDEAVILCFGFAEPDCSDSLNRRQCAYGPPPAKSRSEGSI